MKTDPKPRKHVTLPDGQKKCYFGCGEVIEITNEQEHISSCTEANRNRICDDCHKEMTRLQLLTHQCPKKEWKDRGVYKEVDNDPDLFTEWISYKDEFGNRKKLRKEDIKPKDFQGGRVESNRRKF